MAEYRLQIKPSALKELEALPDDVLARVVQKIDALAVSPRPSGCKKLKGFRDHNFE